MESEVKLAVLSNEVENVKKEVKDTKDIALRIEGKMDSQAALFASKEELNALTSRNKEHLNAVTDRIDKEVLPAIEEVKNKRLLRENILIATVIGQFIVLIIGIYVMFSGKG